MPEIPRAKIRSAAARLIEFTLDELMEVLHVSSRKGRHLVQKAIGDYGRSGLIEKTGTETLRYKGHTLGSLRMKMWRAILIKGKFTQRDIVVLSGASRNYVRMFFAHLKKAGAIKHISGRGYEESLFRLIDPESAPLECPVKCWQPRTKKKGGELN